MKYHQCQWCHGSVNPKTQATVIWKYSDLDGWKAGEYDGIAYIWHSDCYKEEVASR
jgi:hypothetical protein